MSEQSSENAAVIDPQEHRSIEQYRATCTNCETVYMNDRRYHSVTQMAVCANCFRFYKKYTSDRPNDLESKRTKTFPKYRQKCGECHKRLSGQYFTNPFRNAPCCIDCFDNLKLNFSKLQNKHARRKWTPSDKGCDHYISHWNISSNDTSSGSSRTLEPWTYSQEYFQKRYNNCLTPTPVSYPNRTPPPRSLLTQHPILLSKLNVQLSYPAQSYPPYASSHPASSSYANVPPPMVFNKKHSFDYPDLLNIPIDFEFLNLNEMPCLELTDSDFE